VVYRVCPSLRSVRIHSRTFANVVSRRIAVIRVVILAVLVVAPLATSFVIALLRSVLASIVELLPIMSFAVGT
jgi:hypothetical protein